MIQTDSPQFWTDDMVAQFRDYCFPKYDRAAFQFDIFDKFFYISIENNEDDSKHPRKSMDVTYSCHTFGSKLLESIPFYLVLSAEADSYKESTIGYVRIVNGHNVLEEPQAKILAYVRQNLDLESRIDKVISDANFPPGVGKVITLRLDDHYRDRLATAHAVGVKLPIRQLELEYWQGQPKKKWPKR